MDVGLDVGAYGVWGIRLNNRFYHQVLHIQ
jgi:hypothetical protein